MAQQNNTATLPETARKSLNVLIPEDLHKRLAKTAIDRDSSLQALATEAIQSFLESSAA